MKKPKPEKLLLSLAGKKASLLLSASALIIILLIIFMQDLALDIFGALAFLGFILLMPKFFIGLAIGWAFFHFFF